MSDRIRKLAEQAGIEFDDDFPLEPETIYYLKLSDFEKFAELIVRECVALCKSMDETDTRYRYDYRRGVLDCVGTIKEHFGVEE